MANIKDLEEKKLILNFQKLCTNKNLKNIFCNSMIYHSWTLQWQDDFIIDGRQLQIFRNKFVLSATKDRKGIEPPEIYKEYQQIIDDVTAWMFSNYNKKWTRKVNKEKAKELLIQYREKCAEELKDLLSQNESGYTLNYTLPIIGTNEFMYLVNYEIVSNDAVIFSGAYEEVKDYLKEEKLNTEK